MPDFEYAIDDLAHASDEDLRQRALADLPKLGLWIMRDVRNGEALLRALDQWGGLLEAVVRAPSRREAAMRLLRYIALVADKLHVDAFRAKLRGSAPAAEALAMTIAEQMEAKGRAEEQARAARAMLRRDREAVFAVLDARGLHVSDHARARAEASEDLDELRAWLRNAATASHAEDIFR